MQQTAFGPKISEFERLNTRAPDNATTLLTLPDLLQQDVSSELYTIYVFH